MLVPSETVYSPSHYQPWSMASIREYYCVLSFNAQPWQHLTALWRRRLIVPAEYMALERCQLRKTLNIHLLAILLPTKSNILCSKYCDCVKKTSQNFTNHARTEGLDVDRIWLGSISNIAHIVRRFTRSNVEACPNSHISLLNCSAATDYDTLQSGIDKVLAYPGFSPATIQAEKKRLAKTRKTSASGDGPDAMVRDQDREDYKRVFEDSVNPWSSFPNSEYGCPFN